MLFSLFRQWYGKYQRKPECFDRDQCCHFETNFTSSLKMIEMMKKNDEGLISIHLWRKKIGKQLNQTGMGSSILAVVVMVSETINEGVFSLKCWLLVETSHLKREPAESSICTEVSEWGTEPRADQHFLSHLFWYRSRNYPGSRINSTEI